MSENAVVSPRRTLDDWLRWQESLHPVSIDLTLDRIKIVHQALHLNKLAPIVITVAGTNGKGSCVALLESMLTCAGYRVGSYTSPHLLHYNERIRIKGAPVSDNDIVGAFEKIDFARKDITLTYFEFGTLAALQLFSENSLDVVLLEVGLGGRLDATNIIDADVAVISSIGMDHEQWLGHDREAIGFEKAGIMRHGRICVVGDPKPPTSIIRAATEFGASLYCIGRDFDYVVEADSLWRLRITDCEIFNLPFPSLQGGQQLRNAATAVTVLHLIRDRLSLDEECFRIGLRRTALAARYQYISHNPDILLDVAHNPDAFRELATYLSTLKPTYTHLLLGVMSDKKLSAMLPPVLPHVAEWHVAAPNTPRAMPGEAVKSAVQAISDRPVQVYPSVVEAFDAIKSKLSQDHRVVVSGSFFTVAEILARDYNSTPY